MMRFILGLMEQNTQFLLAMQTVGLRRLGRGPQKPNWSWLLESTIHFLRMRTPRGTQIDARQVREMMVQTVPPLGPAMRAYPAAEAPVPGEWLHPVGAPADVVTLYAHGGGYVSGSSRNYRLLTAQIARESGTRVLAVDYRLAPEHPYPAALEDVLATYDWLLAQGIPPEKIVVAGDSAGSGLVLATLLRARASGRPMPAAAVCLSPWLDLTLSGASIRSNAAYDYLNGDLLRACVRMYSNGCDPAEPTISPLYADLQGLPPLLIQIGTAELFLDETLRFVEKAEAAGVPVTLQLGENMVHVWQMLHWLEPQARQALQEAGRFIQAQTSASDA